MNASAATAWNISLELQDECQSKKHQMLLHFQKTTILSPLASGAACLFPDLAAVKRHLSNGKEEDSGSSTLSMYDIANSFRLLPLPSPGLASLHHHDYVDLDAVQAMLSGRVAEKAALVSEELGRSKASSQQRVAEQTVLARESFIADSANFPLSLPSLVSGDSRTAQLLDSETSSTDLTFIADHFGSPLPSQGSEDQDLDGFPPEGQHLLQSLLLPGYEVPIELRKGMAMVAHGHHSTEDISGVQSLECISARNVSGRERSLAFSISPKQSSEDLSPTTKDTPTNDCRRLMPKIPETPAYMVVPVAGVNSDSCTHTQHTENTPSTCAEAHTGTMKPKTTLATDACEYAVPSVQQSSQAGASCSSSAKLSTESSLQPYLAVPIMSTESDSTLEMSLDEKLSCAEKKS